VRELRNVVERAVYRAEDPERPVDSLQFDPFMSPWAPAKGEVVHVDPIDRPTQPQSETSAEPAMAGPAAPPAETNDFRGAVAAYERALLEDALNRSRFNQRATAAALGLSYDQLRHALKRHKLLDAAG
jgi:psp operon transcriptional activator